MHFTSQVFTSSPLQGRQKANRSSLSHHCFTLPQKAAFSTYNPGQRSPARKKRDSHTTGRHKSREKQKPLTCNFILEAVDFSPRSRGVESLPPDPKTKKKKEPQGFQQGAGKIWTRNSAFLFGRCCRRSGSQRGNREALQPGEKGKQRHHD